MDGSQKHYAEGNKVHTKNVYSVLFHLYEIIIQRQK